MRSVFLIPSFYAKSILLSWCPIIQKVCRHCMLDSKTFNVSVGYLYLMCYKSKEIVVVSSWITLTKVSFSILQAKKETAYFYCIQIAISNENFWKNFSSLFNFTRGMQVTLSPLKSVVKRPLGSIFQQKVMYEIRYYYYSHAFLILLYNFFLRVVVFLTKAPTTYVLLLFSDLSMPRKSFRCAHISFFMMI